MGQKDQVESTIKVETGVEEEEYDFVKIRRRISHAIFNSEDHEVILSIAHQLKIKVH